MLKGFQIAFGLIALSSLLNQKPITGIVCIALIIGAEKLFGSREKSNKNSTKNKNNNFDYYIEPCQLCISRNGSTYDTCGWCNDDDTHFKTSDGKYPGDYIKITAENMGYPFHNSPQETRKYYKNNVFIAESIGKRPADV